MYSILKKNGTKSCQYCPYLTINPERIPPVKADDSLTYPGKGVDCTKIKDNIINDIWSYIRKIDVLPLNPKKKTLTVRRFIFSKLRWPFSIYHLTETCVKQNIDDANLKKCYRKWLNMPISGNISHLCLPAKYLGLNISAAEQVYNNCKLSVRRILKTSINPDARKLFNLTMNRNAKIDDVITSLI